MIKNARACSLYRGVTVSRTASRDFSRDHLEISKSNLEFNKYKKIREVIADLYSDFLK